MAAGVFPFTIDAFAEFLVDLYWTNQNNQPIDITNYQMQMDIAPDFGHPPSFTLTTANGGVVLIDPIKGHFQMYISPAHTGAFPLCTGVHLLLIKPPGEDPQALLRGTIQVAQGIQPFQPQ